MTVLQPLNKLIVLRRALGAAAALVIALMGEHFYADTPQLWISVTAVLIMLVSYDADIKQVIQCFLIVVASVFVAAKLGHVVHATSALFILAAVLVVLCCVLEQLFYAFLFMPVACVFMLMVTPMFGDIDNYALMHDVVMGGIIGVVARGLFFSGSAATDFRQRVVLVLNVYSQYLSAIGELLLQQPEAALHCEQQKIAVEKVLQAEFPHWVYQRGFNPVLQQGHRHFLVRLEQIGEILFAMNYAARRPVTPDLLKGLQASMQQSIDGAQNIIAALIVRLRTESFDKPVSDLQDEITQLENNYRAFIDLPIELVDTSQDAMTLSAVIYGLKDLQKNLVKIAEALRK
ncbi:MAG: FUSC family protein [Pseudomonadota bacterium]